MKIIGVSFTHVSAIALHAGSGKAKNQDTPKPERSVFMSLTVSPELLEAAKADAVTDEQFLDCVRDSLPYAWKVVDQLASQLGTGATHAVDRTNPPTDKDQGELLRLMASSPMRAAVERHYGVKLEFQNCCTTGAFKPEAVGGAAHQEFVSPRAQLLNQSPELVNC